LLITGPYFKQSFDVYTRSPLPPFVTSDSVLDAFNALLAATIRYRDVQQAKALRIALEGTWKAVAASPDASRIALVIGPPLRLLGSPVPLGDPATEVQVADQVARIMAGTGRALPDWLEPDAQLSAIDYALFKPVGLQAGNPELEAYYRAVRWLQTLPLREDHPTEAHARLTLFRAWLGHSNGMGAHDDTMALLGLEPERDGMIASRYVLLPTYRFPEFDWIQEWAAARPASIAHLGLSIGAWLGSPAAGRLLPEGERLQLQPFLEKASHAHSLGAVQRYYDALRSLYAPADPAAPEFMRGDLWARKSLQAGLAGWTEIRHAAELAAKRNEVTFGMELRPSGFVEPNPLFFESIANAAEEIEMALDLDHLKHDPLDLAQRWHGLDTLGLRLALLAEKELRGSDFTEPESQLLADYGESLAAVMGYEASAWMNPRDDAPVTVAVVDDLKHGLHVAESVGRPRALYVLYPWKGQKILCRGSVQTYYEDVTPDRLTDEAWKDQLTGPQPPHQPDWIRPLLRP
jgi:hypothetical protein